MEVGYFWFPPKMPNRSDISRPAKIAKIPPF
jgi:hypothetical protein